MITALYCRPKSVYSQIPGVDVWTEKRDATKWQGGTPCIAHPPCRAWGKYKTWAKPRPGEKELALLAVQQVRQNSGILEHPLGSGLFSEANLPKPKDLPDEYGGYTVLVSQGAFGHRADKPTLLYCCGVRLPPIPARPEKQYHSVELMGRAERERTPVLFATWLVSALAASSRPTN